MESTKDTKVGGLQSTFSRRNLLGRCGACCRCKCARSFWSTRNRRADRKGLALHQHLHRQSRRLRQQRGGDLFMRAKPFHGEVNRVEARSSCFAGDRNDPVHGESIYDRDRSDAHAPVCRK